MNNSLYILPTDLLLLLYKFSLNNPNFLIFIVKNNIININDIKFNMYMLYNSKINCEFIDIFYNKINWFLLSKFCYLDEDILYRYYDKLNWKYVSLYQYLSVDFIINNLDLLDFKKLILNKNYEKNFIIDLLKTDYVEEQIKKILRSKKRYKKYLYLFDNIFNHHD